MLAPRSFLIPLAMASVGAVFPLALILLVKWPSCLDMLFNSAILNAFSSQFWSGDLYARWLTGVNAGFGSPVMLYYGPLVFWVASAFEWLAAVDPFGFFRIVATMGVGLFAAGLTSYRWLRGHMAEKEAQMGAFFYVGLLYFQIFIYMIFAISQLWAAVWFPLLLLAADRVMARDRRGILLMALAYALLMLTHLPSLMVFGAVPVLYVLALSAPSQRWRNGLWVVLAGALAVGMAAGYLLPASANAAYIDTKQYFTRLYFLWRGDHRIWIGLPVMVLPLLAFFVQVPRALRGTLSPQVRFWIMLLTVMLFFCLPVSRPYWWMVPPLRFIAFPSRLLFGMLPGVVFLLVTWLPHAKSRLIYAIFPLIGVAFLLNSNSFPVFVSERKMFGRIMDQQVICADEYSTRWMLESGLRIGADFPAEYQSMDAVTWVKGEGSARITAQTSRRMVVDAQVSSPDAVMVLRRIYMPGWQVASGAAMMAFPYEGLVAVSVPQGHQHVELALPWFEGEKLGAMISAGSVAVWLGCWVGLRRKRVANAM